MTLLLALHLLLGTCFEQKLQLSHGIDDSAGGVSAYIITTPSTIYYLEKEGGGLSSMIDRDGVDWIGFNNEKGSGWKGEYRGFPNAVHRQDGSYFHALNSSTDLSTSVIEIETDHHIRIVFTSDNGKWKGQWDFYLDRCDFTISKVSEGYKYWVLYEGVPGGEMDSTDFWYASANKIRHPIEEPYVGDLPSPEWMAFGDKNSPRMLFLLHHEDDEFADDYIFRPFMTVFGFGRQNGETTEKLLTKAQTFSIGFVESKRYVEIQKVIKRILK